MEFIRLFPMIIWNILSLVTKPIFWIVLVIIWFQFRRLAERKSKFFNQRRESVWKPTLMATLFGLLGGVLGSCLLVLVGISVLEIGIQYLWPIAIAMMFVNQRFMCFAYAGGLISIVKYFFGVPDISIAQVMGLVAILHLVEAVLICFSGHLGAMPIYVQDKQGQLVGGFNLQNFWPLPIVAMVALTVPETTVLPEIIKMPDWWPLIKSEMLVNQENIVYLMLPVIAGLGYGDIALTSGPKEKSGYSAFNLSIFSLVLLGLAILSSYYPEMSILAALFSPLGHELVIFLGKKSEYRGPAKFVQPKRGVMILDLLSNSPLKRAGLTSGDIIMTVNDGQVDSSGELLYALQFVGKVFVIEYLDNQRKVFQRRIISKKSLNEPLGIITVPDNSALTSGDNWKTKILDEG